MTRATIEFDARVLRGATEWGNDYTVYMRSDDSSVEQVTGHYRVTLTPIEVEEEVKPCPFCGDDAKLHSRDNVVPTWAVVCTNGDCFASMSDDYGRRDATLRLWNRRAL